MINIKGSPKGIMITIEDFNESAKDELFKKLSETAGFFNEETLEVFLTSTSLTEAEVFALRPVVEEALPNTQIIFIEEPPKMLPKQHSPLDDLGYDEGITKFVRRTIDAGEELSYENNLIIIGDVKSGAKISAGGNVFVLGTLFGSVSITKPDGVVVAMKLLPESLSIAGISATIKASTLKKLLSAPEIAYLLNEEIKIEQYT